MQLYAADTAVREVLDDIASGRFSPEEPERHRGIVNALLWGGDHYLLLADFQSYLAAQRRSMSAIAMSVNGGALRF